MATGAPTPYESLWGSAQQQGRRPGTHWPGSEQGGHYNVGYPGTPERNRTGGVLFGSRPGTPLFGATQQAYQDKQSDWERALETLRGRQFLPDGAGNAAMSMFTSPRGFDEQALQGRRTAAAETAAGSRENALAQLEAAARARGFGNSAATMDAGARIRTGSAADLNRSLNEIMYENERARLQQQGIAGGMLSSFAGQEGSRLRSLSDLYADRPRDVIPGISDAKPGQSPWRFLNERGEIMPRQGWSQADWEAAMRERQQFMATQGRQAA